MKSKHDFATEHDYHEYLIAYYVGQILSRTGLESSSTAVYLMATVIAGDVIKRGRE